MFIFRRFALKGSAFSIVLMSQGRELRISSNRDDQMKAKIITKKIPCQISEP